jgi:ankyrin repeat protein
MVRYGTAAAAVLLAAAMVLGCAEKKPDLSLHDAVQQGNLAEVKRLLDAGHDVNAADEGGATPLHVAAFQGDHDMVQLLLGRGADRSARDADGDTPADFAKNDDVKAVIQGR